MGRLRNGALSNEKAALWVPPLAWPQRGGLFRWLFALFLDRRGRPCPARSAKEGDVTSEGGEEDCPSLPTQSVTFHATQRLSPPSGLPTGITHSRRHNYSPGFQQTLGLSSWADNSLDG